MKAIFKIIWALIKKLFTRTKKPITQKNKPIKIKSTIKTIRVKKGDIRYDLLIKTDNGETTTTINTDYKKPKLC